jgi:hypothetical protein
MEFRKVGEPERGTLLLIGLLIIPPHFLGRILSVNTREYHVLGKVKSMKSSHRADKRECPSFPFLFSVP